jgi:hypothetical protein
MALTLPLTHWKRFRGLAFAALAIAAAVAIWQFAAYLGVGIVPRWADAVAPCGFAVAGALCPFGASTRRELWHYTPTGVFFLCLAADMAARNRFLTDPAAQWVYDASGAVLLLTVPVLIYGYALNRKRS